MKKTLLLISLLYFAVSFSTKAQITVTSADLPVAGTMVINAVDTITPVSAGNPGINQVWDFSNLVASRFDTIIYRTPEGVPGFENFPQANIVYDYRTSFHCEGCPVIIYAYVFLNQNDNNLSIYGEEAQHQFNGGYILNLHGYFTDGSILAHLPMNYSNSAIDSATYELYLGYWYEGVMFDSSMVVVKENVVRTVDASGTLITPYNTFQVLRVKEDVTTAQTNYSYTPDGWVFVFEDTHSETIYNWYTNDYFLVGTVDDDGKGPGFTFFKSSTVVGIESNYRTSEINIYPNPVGDQLTIQTDNQIEEAAIYTLNGQEVLSLRNSPRLDVSLLNSGLYMLKVITGEGATFTKFIKQ